MKFICKGYRRISRAGLAFCIISLIISLFFLAFLAIWLIPNHWALISFMKTIIPKIGQESLTATSPFLIIITITSIVFLSIRLFGTSVIFIDDDELGFKTDDKIDP